MEGDRTVPPGSATILRLTGMGLRAHQLLQCKEAAALLQTILPQYPDFCYDMPTASSFASLSSFLVSLFLKSRYMLNGKKTNNFQQPSCLLSLLIPIRPRRVVSQGVQLSPVYLLYFIYS